MIKRLSTGIVAIVVLVGCGPSGGPITVAEVEQVPSPQVDTTKSGFERFNGGRAATMAPAASASPAASELADLFDYDVAESWKSLPGNDMRLLNFSIGEGDGAAECYVSILPGDGGGLESNVNRWRAQMGADPLSSEDIEALPSITLMGRPATLVQAEGSFRGMGDGPVIEDAKLLGALFIAQGRAVFVKMVGPGATVDAEAAHFADFCSSLRPKGAPASGDSTPAPSAGDESEFDPADISWHAPDGWKRGRESSMRIVTYNTGAEGKTEISVIVLPGTAGGIEANINRWYGQMGVDPLSSEALAALPTVSVLGVDSPMAEAHGTYRGMGDVEDGDDYTLLGAVCTLPSHSIFVKMTGPSAEVAVEKDNFIAFCESLALGE